MSGPRAFRRAGRHEREHETVQVPGKIIVAVAALGFGAAAVAGPAHADLASHRALYTMRLDSSDAASEIAALEGRMSLKFVEVCDGWTTEQRTVLRIVDSLGGEILTYTSFLSWESKDGRRFRFQQETRHDGITVEEIRGEATLDDETGGSARLTRPENVNLVLPPGTVFPMRHTEEVIAEARAGKNHVLRTVFDGSTLDNPNDVSAFIVPVAETRDVPGLAKASQAWRMRLAFFAVGVQAVQPDVEISLVLRDDGIALEVRWEYEGFAVMGILDSIEILTPESC
jgi:hypothetical protein